MIRAAMLVIVSDLHLTDGTSGQTIKENAFRIFVGRVREMAFDASWRTGDRYRPVERVDILLLGDILDVIRSTRWLEGERRVRPWSDSGDVRFVEKVNEISDAILKYNEPSLQHLRSLARPGGLLLPPTRGPKGSTRVSGPGVPVEVGIHYMVGNHDWFYHLPDAAFHPLRAGVVNALGLINEPGKSFPHDPEESARIAAVLRAHGVLARHGDIFDPFNFTGSRDGPSPGDGVVVELVNRFHLEVGDRLGTELPRPFVEGLRELDNVRPVVAVPVWIDALMREHGVYGKQAGRVKVAWNDLVDEFLDLDFIREQDSVFNPFDNIDRLESALRFTRDIPLSAASALGAWWNDLASGPSGPGGPSESYHAHAAGEKAVVDREARHVVYGHTHHHEIVPLDAARRDGRRVEQVYFNAGTWRRVHRLARSTRSHRSFVAYDVMTYLAFFKDDERKGRPFACWSGALGDARG